MSSAHLGECTEVPELPGSVCVVLACGALLGADEFGAFGDAAAVVAHRAGGVRGALLSVLCPVAVLKPRSQRSVRCKERRPVLPSRRRSRPKVAADLAADSMSPSAAAATRLHTRTGRASDCLASSYARCACLRPGGRVLSAPALVAFAHFGVVERFRPSASSCSLRTPPSPPCPPRVQHRATGSPSSPIRTSTPTRTAQTPSQRTPARRRNGVAPPRPPRPTPPQPLQPRTRASCAKDPRAHSLYADPSPPTPAAGGAPASATKAPRIHLLPQRTTARPGGLSRRGNGQKNETATTSTPQRLQGTETRRITTTTKAKTTRGVAPCTRPAQGANAPE